MSGDAPLAIIAGGGRLPAEVADAAIAAGRRIVMIAIRYETEAEVERFSPHWLHWGQIGRLFAVLKAEGCREVVMIGSVTRRPDFLSLVGDPGTIRRLPRILSAMIGGDDSILKRVISIFEQEGFHVVGVIDVAPALLASAETLTRRKPGVADAGDIDAGMAVAAGLGVHDVGQSVVVVGGRIVAVEAAEGTDAMIDRCRHLRDSGRITWKGRAGVLVKCAKPTQDLRADLPTVGPETVERVASAGLAGIGMEAGRVLVAERERLIDLADRYGIFVTGIDKSGIHSGR